MTKYVVKRILLMFLTLFVIMTICFILIKLLPLPLVKSINKDVALQAKKYEQRGYYKPIMVQYYNFWRNVLTQWNWGVGEQLYTDREVWPVMMQKLPYTVFHSDRHSAGAGVRHLCRPEKEQMAGQRDLHAGHAVPVGAQLCIRIPGAIFLVF